jgi:uncharacterized protein YegL
MALETAHLSVITFARQAQQVVPLTDLFRFQLPPLKVKTGTALGAALKLLRECLSREVRRSSATSKGDYKPLVFLLTDGQPTDEWQEAAEALRRINPRPANLYAIGCGPDIDVEVLRQITDIVLLLDDLHPQAFKRFFVWLSGSVQSASLRPDAGTDSLGLLPLPASVRSLSLDEEVAYDPTPRQVFLRARCNQTRKPYLMRFARRPHDDRYEAIAGHVLDDLEEDEDLLPPVPSDQLDGCPPCPHCENPTAGMCPCGTLFCTAPDHPGPVTCPSCKSQLFRGEGGPFEIRRSLG